MSGLTMASRPSSGHLLAVSNHDCLNEMDPSSLNSICYNSILGLHPTTAALIDHGRLPSADALVEQVDLAAVPFDEVAVSIPYDAAATSAGALYHPSNVRATLCVTFNRVASE